jgi:hypothetical protein
MEILLLARGEMDITGVYETPVSGSCPDEPTILMSTPLHKLSFTQYSLLLASGLMFEVYPEATGEYDKDVPADCFEVPDGLRDKIEIKVFDNEFCCGFANRWGLLPTDLMPYIGHIKSGALQGGGTFFSRRGKTRYEAFTAFFNEIKGSYLMSDSKSDKDRSRDTFYVEADLTTHLSRKH